MSVPLLRQLWCVRLLPLFWVTGVVLLFVRTGWWWEVAGASRWASAGLIVLGPLLAGVAAFDTCRLISPASRPLFDGLPRRPGVVTQIVAAGVVCLFSAWLASEVVAVTVAAARGGAVDPDLLQAVEALGLAVVFSALGVCVGLLLPSILAAPVAAVSAYIAAPVLSSVGNWAAFRANGGDGRIAGLIREPGPVFIALLVNVAISWALLRVVTRRLRGPRPGWVAVAVLAVAVLGPAALPYSDYRIDPAPRRTCVDGPPRVCVLRGHEGYLPPLAGQISDAAQALSALGLTPQPQYWETIDGGPTQPEIGTFSPPSTMTSDPTLTGEDVAELFSFPRQCPEAMDSDLSLVRSDFITLLGVHLDTSRLSAHQAETIRGLYHQLEQCEP